MNNHLLPAFVALIAAAPAHAATKWASHHTGKPAFTVQTPAGWTVQTAGGQILLRSSNGSGKVLVEGFSGGSASDRISKVAAARPDLFPGAKLGAVTKQAAQGDAAAASLTYAAGGKTGQARLLASVSHGSGMLYAIAAPSDRFAADKPTLLRIVKSLRFDGPATRTAAAPAGAKLRFVKWIDPKEHAFSFQAPAGWKVDGGAFRIAATHVNEAVALISPDNSMLVRFNDANIPLLQEPNPGLMQMYGVGEGQPYNPGGTYLYMFLHFMPAAEFNTWYANKVLSPNIDDFHVTKTTPLTNQARAAQNALQKIVGGTGQVQVTGALTEFKGVEKQTHKPITGAIASTIQRTQSPNGLGTWGPMTLVICGCNDGEGVQTRENELRSVVEHISGSWKNDPRWNAAEERRREVGTAQVVANSRASIANAMARSKAVAASSASSEDSIMSGYWKRVGAQDNMQRQQANYYGDRTDVGNGSQSFNVGAGYKSYYYNSRANSVVGTNSADQPGVDFTPLSQY